MNMTELASFLSARGRELSEKQISQFERFCSLLIDKNKVMNLTAIDDPAEIEIKHFIDSIASVSLIDEISPQGFSLLDVGCGAGFPGIPLKILFPENRFALLDSLNKRINFVNEVIRELELKQISAVACRAEDFPERGNFDICVSRAVARMNVLLEYCLPFVKIGGYCLLYKSGDCQEEIDEAEHAISVLGGSFIQCKSFELPHDAGSRSFVIIQKIAETPSKYPRRAGKPSKSPL